MKSTLLLFVTLFILTDISYYQNIKLKDAYKLDANHASAAKIGFLPHFFVSHDNVLEDIGSPVTPGSTQISSILGFDLKLNTWGKIVSNYHFSKHALNKYRAIIIFNKLNIVMTTSQRMVQTKHLFIKHYT